MTHKSHEGILARWGWPKWARFVVRLTVAVIGSLILATVFQRAEELISKDPAGTARRLAQVQTEVQIATGLILHLSDITAPEVNPPLPSRSYLDFAPPQPGCADDLLHTPPTSLTQSATAPLTPAEHNSIASGGRFADNPTLAPSLGEILAHSHPVPQKTSDLASLHLAERPQGAASPAISSKTPPFANPPSTGGAFGNAPISVAPDFKASKGHSEITFKQPTPNGSSAPAPPVIALSPVTPLETVKPIRSLACAIYLNHKNPFRYPLPAGISATTTTAVAATGRPTVDVHLHHWVKLAPIAPLKPAYAFADAVWSLSTTGPLLRKIVFRVAFGLGLLASGISVLPDAVKSGNPLKMLFFILVLFPAETVIVAALVSLVFHWIVALGALLFGWLTALAGLAAALGALGTCCSVALTKALEVTAQQRVEHIGELL